jgi:polar amino acid transport system substrate-binding protein
MMSSRKHLFRILALVSALAVGSFVQVAKAGVLDDIAKSGTIRIAVPQDYPPFGMVVADMKLSGYDIDMANLIGEELGVKLELVPVSSTNRVPFLVTGKVDLIVSSLGKNAEREKVIDFSDAYAPFFNGVFGPEDIKAEKIEDLAGKTIAITRGTIEDLELSRIAPAGAVFKRFEDNNATVAAYLSGQTQLIATGNVIAAAVNERSKLRRLSTKFLVKNSPCYVGLLKGETTLRTKINEIIAKARQSGALNEISQRWLHASLPTDL